MRVMRKKSTDRLASGALLAGTVKVEEPYRPHPFVCLDLGFRASDFGFQVSGFEFRALGFRLRVSGFRSRASGFRLRISVTEFKGLGVDG